MSEDPIAVAEEVANKLGEEFVIAGGAARDVWHGNTPKDFDVFVLNGEAAYETVEDASARTLACLKRILFEATGFVVYNSYRDEEGGRIAYCIKFTYKGVAFDVIECMQTMHSAKEQVENFDVTLNMVWFILDIDGHLYVTAHPRFREVVSYQAFVHALPTLDGDVRARLSYLQKKYPEYVYTSKPRAVTKEINAA